MDEESGGMSMAGMYGRLGAIVWPIYLGVATGHPGNGVIPLDEPFDKPGYERGQIMWTKHADEKILGTARLWLPLGVFTHFVWCWSPDPGPMSLVNATQMEHPLVVTEVPFALDVDPITYMDVLPKAEAR
jgi:hypothetical protein